MKLNLLTYSFTLTLKEVSKIDPSGFKVEERNVGAHELYLQF
jgi:hypothetical protein